MTPQRTGVGRLVPHALVRLKRPDDRLAVNEGDAHTLADRVWFAPASARTSARKDSMRWSIGFPRSKDNAQRAYRHSVIDLGRRCTEKPHVACGTATYGRRLAAKALERPNA